jgi:tRNA-specific adenosine deaminase 1
VVLEPTDRELRVVAMHQAVPFVGFGIMDNSILILAGEAIDINLGATLGISTMCAAAIGNIGADLVRAARGMGRPHSSCTARCMHGRP